MVSRRSVKVLIGSALVGLLLSSVQAAEMLPKQMSGRWTAETPRGPMSDVWSVEIDSQDGGGAISGRVSHVGISCGAKDEPMQGTFDGSTLVITSQLRAGVNSAQAKGNCQGGKITWTLKAKEGTQSFEGEANLEGPRQVKVVVTLGP